MTEADDKAVRTPLTVSIEERLLAPLKRNVFAARTWFALALVTVLVFHIAALAAFLYRDDRAELKVAKQEETPVEVVVEPPKPPEPPPAPKQPQPKPEAKQEIEKPASSAPRKPNEEKVETAKLDEKTQAPKAETPPTDGKPEKAADAGAPEDDPTLKDETEEAAKKEPDDLKKDAEALDKIVPLPPKKPEAKVAKAKPTTKAKRQNPSMQQLAGLSNLPDYKFARPTKKSKIYGGSEDSRYLAIVYGMIMSKRRPIVAPDDMGTVTVSFEVDDSGNVLSIELTSPSGYPTVDAEAVNAIRRASPFPPLPPGAPHGLVATINFAQAPPSYLTGER